MSKKNHNFTFYIFIQIYSLLLQYSNRVFLHFTILHKVEKTKPNLCKSGQANTVSFFYRIKQHNENTKREQV